MGQISLPPLQMMLESQTNRGLCNLRVKSTVAFVHVYFVFPFILFPNFCLTMWKLLKFTIVFSLYTLNESLLQLTRVFYNVRAISNILRKFPVNCSWKDIHLDTRINNRIIISKNINWQIDSWYCVCGAKIILIKLTKSTRFSHAVQHSRKLKQLTSTSSSSLSQSNAVTCQGKALHMWPTLAL